jgi:acyl carrier protein
MGLDAVEIVMAIEEAFDIQIEDSEAELLLTPRDVIGLVLLKTSRSQNSDCLTQRAFNRLRAAFIKQAGVTRKRIKPKARIADFVSRNNRRQVVRRVLDEIQVSHDPQFVRPLWLIGVICIFSIVIGVGSALFVRHNDIPLNTPVILVPMIAVVFCWFGLQMTKKFRYELDAPVATFGGMSRWVVAARPEFIAIEPGKWTREQIAIQVREIVVEQLGCEKAYDENARFIEDLGLG